MNIRNIKYLNSGRHRDAYLLPSGLVLKVPNCQDGYLDNHLEAIRSGKDEWIGKDQKARCKLLKNGWLLMVYVEPFNGRWNELPSWTGGVDCAQVGFTKAGKLVAFDYA